MPDEETALAEVVNDVVAGLSTWLSHEDLGDDGGFLPPDSRDRAGIMRSDAGDIAVQWAWRGRHVGRPPKDDDPHDEPDKQDVMGYLPTGEVIEVHGVTIVRDGPDGPLLSRYVDWVSALAQIGVPLGTRPVIDTPPPAPLD